MAFTHGKNANVYMGSLDLTSYLRSVSDAAAVDTAETSTFGTDDKTYVPGLRDATMSMEGFFDRSAAGAGSALNAVLGGTAKQLFSAYFGGDSLGSPGAGLQGDTTSFEVTSDIGDVVSVTGEAQSSVGFERLISHHAHGAESAAGTSTAIDNGAATTHGGAAYLHVTALTGSMAIFIEHSTDNNTFTTLANFGTVTAVGGTRVAVAGTVNRYTRLVRTPATTGTATFVAGLARDSLS